MTENTPASKTDRQPGKKAAAAPWWQLTFSSLMLLLLTSYNLATSERIIPWPRTHIGHKLAWRKIVSLGLFPSHYKTIVGQFDKDDDQELVICIDTKSIILLNASGKREQIGINISDFVYKVSAWDYNADGIDDLVYQDVNPFGYPVSSGIQVTELEGRRLANLTGGDWCLDSPVLQSGNGKSPQLILANGSDNAFEILFYEQKSRDAAPVTIHRSIDQLEALDLDHDGIDEIIALQQGTGKQDTWLVIRNKKVLKRYIMPKPTYNSNFVKINATGDIGYFYKSDAYVNLTDNSRNKLQYPAAIPKTDEKWAVPWYSITSGDFLGRGELQLAIAYGANYSKSGILLFAATGECLYYQELGCEIRDVACLRAGGRDHLIVLCKGNVLIYP